MRRKAPGRHCRQAKKIRNRLWRYENMNLDMAAKRRKKHKKQIPNHKWFDKPIDRLTVLSKVEGLTTLSQVEGQIPMNQILKIKR